MPALNFTVFVDKVEDGSKRCTIRAKRKRPIKVGDTLQLYTGMRHKNCRKLGEGVCRCVTPIVIDGIRVLLGDEDLTSEEIVTLALADGFDSGSAFLDYFNRASNTETHLGDKRFEGYLIRW